MKWYSNILQLPFKIINREFCEFNIVCKVLVHSINLRVDFCLEMVESILKLLNWSLIVINKRRLFNDLHMVLIVNLREDVVINRGYLLKLLQNVFESKLTLSDVFLIFNWLPANSFDFLFDLVDSYFDNDHVSLISFDVECFWDAFKFWASRPFIVTWGESHCILLFACHPSNKTICEVSHLDLLPRHVK